MTAIMEAARKHGLKVVEDAALAIGAEWNGQRCGSFGDFAIFSFQGAKLFVTGEGGMLVTNDEALYKRAYKIWDQGRNPSKVFWIDEDGVKFKMSNVQAALGLAQIERRRADRDEAAHRALVRRGPRGRSERVAESQGGGCAQHLLDVESRARGRRADRTRSAASETQGIEHRHAACFPGD
ncbi:hypothetical protein PPGU19_026790 [Paraburkholderia sp. PGU19]|nr:hypothetical protein PPGU19_026790 [Paraburkholderia sp. PGU19]